MSIDSSTQHEKMRILSENLLAVEADRAGGSLGCSVEELDRALEDVLNEV